MYRIKSIALKTLLFGFLFGWTNGFGQTNRYFQNNECWSIYQQQGISTSVDYYISVNGDTVIGTDTLVKLIFYGTHFYGVNPDYLVGSPYSPSFLAKESNQILTVYKLEADTISDTLVTDYSRTDSLTCISTTSYFSLPISDTDSFEYYDNERNIYFLNSLKSFEGIFDLDGLPLITEGGSFLTCFSALDSLIYAFNGSYEFIHPYIAGNCIIHNVGFEDNTLNDVIRIFPNPVSTNLTIEQNQLVELMYLLTDINGRELQKGIILSKDTILNIELLEPGTYFIKFFNQNYSAFSKFIKQ